jgi:hypothetical protein
VIADARRKSISGTRGYALMTSLVFLTILTTVGIFTLKNTALEIMMSANNNKSAQAFEAAESSRTIVNQLIDAHVYNRGWPKSLGGAIENYRFNNSIPEGLTLTKNGSAPSPRNWYEDLPQTSSSFKPLDLSQIDGRYNRNISSSGSIGFTLQGSAAVRLLRTDLEAGSNSAMSSGYEGLGKGAASGGGNIFFYVVAQGQDPSAQATRYTASVYRYSIRN